MPRETDQGVSPLPSDPTLLTKKCDEAVPQCSQCRKYGRPCPGYRRTFRFQDEGPALQRRHQTRSQSRRPDENTRRSPDGTADAAAAAAVRNNALAMMRQTSSQDSSQAHSQMQIQLQQPHLFASFLHSAFPTLYTSNLFRAHNRPDFLAHITSSYASGSAPYLAATLACLTSIYTAQFSPDKAQHTRRSRQLYAHALTHVVAALHSAAALSAPLLATIMMLAVYEMYARTSPDAFVVHVDGVRRIMLARGPGLHFAFADEHAPTNTNADSGVNTNSTPSEQLQASPGEGAGFARGCYIAFRGFLVASAIYERRACFLDEDGWLRLAGRIRAEDVRKAEADSGRHAAVVDVCERIWMEVVRCPRYLAEALPEGLPGGRRRPEGEGEEGDLGQEIDEGLVARVRGTRARLVQLVRELKSALGGEGVGQEADTGPGLLLQGAEDMVAALQSLLVWLRVGRGRGGFRVVSDFQRGVSSASSEALPVTWLDRVASSMGVIGLRIIWEDAYR